MATTSERSCAFPRFLPAARFLLLPSRLQSCDFNSASTRLFPHELRFLLVASSPAASWEVRFLFLYFLTTKWGEKHRSTFHLNANTFISLADATVKHESPLYLSCYFFKGELCELALLPLMHVLVAAQHKQCVDRSNWELQDVQ